MTTKNLSGIITWLKNWFYDKDEVENLIPNDVSDLTNTQNKTFAPSKILIPRATSSGPVDLKIYTSQGFYYYNGSSTNELNYIEGGTVPVTHQRFVMFVECVSDVYVKQTITDLSSENTFIRTSWNGSWRAWKQLTLT